MRLFAGYRRSPAKRVSPITRYSLLALLVITLMGVSALTACDSDNDANTPTAIPAAMATPALTVSQGGSTDSGSTTPSTQAASLSIPTSGSEELRIMSQDSKLIELDLNPDDTLILSYSGFAPQGANARTALFVPVDFLILDPANEPLLEAGGLVRNFVDVQVETSGIHRLVFTNPARFQGRIVSVDYYISPLASAPTATATPASTVSLAGGTDSGSTTPPTQAVVLSAPSSGSEELFIISQDSELIELDLNAGDTLTVSYVGSGGVTSNRDIPLLLPVEFLILDPANEPLLEAGGLVRNFVDVQVETSGIHRLVFTNPARFQGRIVSVDYYISPLASAPTAPATPASTVSQAGSTDPGDTTPPTQAAGLSAPSSGSEELRIRSQDSELIELDLNAGDTLIISYSGFGIQTANARTALLVPVDFLILDPANEPLLEAGGLVRNFVDVQVETSGIHQLVFTNPARLQALEALVDYYISPSTAAPTVTPTPTPTVSLDGSTDSNSTTPSTQAASLSIPFSGDEILFIPSQNTELFELDLNAGDTLKVSYFTSVAVIGTSTASPPASPIEFLILDPANEPLLEVGALEENSVEVRVAITGTHQLVFTNPARLQALEALVEYAVNP